MVVVGWFLAGAEVYSTAWCKGKSDGLLGEARRKFAFDVRRQPLGLTLSSCWEGSKEPGVTLDPFREGVVKPMASYSDYPSRVFPLTILTSQYAF